MSTARLVTWITLLGVFAMAARVSLDTDTWWHLRAGAWMMEHREILQADPFSYTRQGAEWQYPGWIVQIPMAWLFQTFGPGGLNVWTASMVTLAFVFVWRTLEGGPFLKAFVVVLGATVTGVYWSARPYIVSFVLAAVFLWVLEDFRRLASQSGKKDRLWLLPVLMILWANSHGAFVVGFMLGGIYGMERLAVEGFRLAAHLRDKNKRSTFNLETSTKRLALIGLLLVFAVCLNPSGPVMLGYAFKTVSIESLQDYIQEWQSPNFHNVQFQPFAWMLLLIFGAVGTARQGMKLVDFLLVCVFAYLGFIAARNVALFGLVGTVVLARYAGPGLERAREAWGVRFPARLDRVRSPLQGWVNRALVGVVLLMVLLKTLTVLPASENDRVLKGFLPLDAVAFLKENQPEGRLFNSYNWGAYVLWALPTYPVFVDGRTDLYNDEIISQWFQIFRAEAGWQETLARWEINVILLEQGAPVLTHLEGEGWQKIYEDDLAVVYAKK
ncbi:MAG: hypothetical protein HUU38_10625 [Anaerolineales bacterium]|nr:hypothetical protein [Anaerolineales bacterium]